MNRRIAVMVAIVLLLTMMSCSGHAETMRVVNCKNWVSLRAQPSTSAERVTTIPLGATVNAWYYNSQWYECEYMGMYGYVLSTYLSNGTSSSGASSSPAYLGKMYVINCNEFVTLRSAPSTSASSITKVAKGQQVDAYAYNGQFYRCYYNGMEGYILSQYLGYTSQGSSGWSNSPSYGSSWGSSPDTTSDKYDLSNYDYRWVVTKGRGALVFQKSPRGSFMSSYKYTDGDAIYVNLYWRQNGYAIAYENGVYGYVDASYISW